MLTQHKELLPEMVKTESLNNQNECIFKAPLHCQSCEDDERGPSPLGCQD